MDLKNKKIWQIAAGDTNRNYVNLLLYWSIVAIGPGCFGPWPGCVDRMREKGVTDRTIADIERFYGMQSGDIVVLRLGTKKVCAIGEIANVESSYAWLDDFGDIDGWDIQHTKRVNWFLTKEKILKSTALKWGDTVRELGVNEEVIKLISELEPKTPSKTCLELPSSRSPEQRLRRLEFSELCDSLKDGGFCAKCADQFPYKMAELIDLAAWYSKNNTEPSEHETVAYLVIPLLRALGWTPQQMAIEWNRIDIALFDKMPREDENLTVTVEVKKRNNSCLTAQGQAKGYAKESGRDNCNRIVVTDGVRYGVYLRDKPNGDFQNTPIAYMNLVRLVDSYPILGMGKQCFGAKESLLAMSPNWDDTIPGYTPD